MPFRLDMSVETLRQVAAILAAERAVLDSETRSDLASLISHYGAEMAGDDAVNVAGSARAFLEELWLLRRALPEAVQELLLAAQGRSAQMMVVTEEPLRAALLKSLAEVADVRHYLDVGRVARDVTRLVESKLDRLSPAERSAWQRLQASRRGTAAAGREDYLVQVEHLLRDYPAVVELLDAAKTWQPMLGAVIYDDAAGRPHRGGQAGVELREMPAASAAAAQVEAAAVVRYGNVHFPATVLLHQQMVPLVVHLAQAPAPGARVDATRAAMSLQAGDVTVVVHPDGFAIAECIGGTPAGTEPGARRVQVWPDRDCEALVYFLNPLELGSKRISVDFYQAGRNLSTLAFGVTIAQRALASDLARVTVEPVPIYSPSTRALPPDLELRVTLSQDRRTLYYTLHSPGDSAYHFKSAGERRLNDDPQRVLGPVYERLSNLARLSPPMGEPAAVLGRGTVRSETQTVDALAELADIGANLYADLFSPELKQEYARLRERFRGGSLLITTDEPWIPWEMVRPVDSDESGALLFDDPHLCEMFQVSRWLAGRGAPDEVRVRKGAWVAAAKNLAAVENEQSYFRELHRRQWQIAMDGPLSTVADVEERFRLGDTELLHFACHGNFDASDPNESKLRLVDQYLRPSQITGHKLAGLRRARPLVFLNTCHSGDRGFALTQLGGWAERFLEAGASAFVGSLWEINDRLAAHFAAEFYNRLWGLNGCVPTPLGQAFYEARLAIRDLDPANPTWLAYVLYGDPRGVVRLG